MGEMAWSWTDLSADRLGSLAAAEESLGADYLLAFQSGGEAVNVGVMPASLAVADLNEVQVECLQGLENQLGTVIVAYNKEN